MSNSAPSSLTRLIEDLVRIDSVNPSLAPDHPGEAELASFVARWCAGRGLEVRRLEATPGRPSLLVTARGTGGGGTLLLNAHLDTVGVTGMEAPFTPTVSDGRLYGRGAYDMKASLAACMLALEEVASLALPGDVVLAAVADEEDGSLGTQETLAHLAASGVKPAGAIVTEPSELELQVAHRGFAVIEVELEGRASHTAKPEAGVNALTHLGRLLGRVEAAAEELGGREQHPLLGTGSLQPVLASGGQELYTTPARATATLERRTVPGESLATATGEIEAILGAMRAEDGGVRARTRTLLAREPFEVPTGSRVVKAVAEAAEAVTGAPAQLTGAPYWTDAALVAAAGIPTVLYGPSGGGIHQPVEWVDLASVQSVRRVLVETARVLCGARTPG